MNIFVLHSHPSQAARMHCDKHVVKMVLESAQILSTVAGWGYRPTHANHPCTVWARESESNFLWLYDLGVALGKEYTHRYGKRHKSSFVIHELYEHRPTLPSIGLTPFAQAMPPQYRQECAVEAYRAYYMGEKAHMLRYTRREVPSWVTACSHGISVLN